MQSFFDNTLVLSSSRASASASAYASPSPWAPWAWPLSRSASHNRAWCHAPEHAGSLRGLLEVNKIGRKERDGSNDYPPCITTTAIARSGLVPHEKHISQYLSLRPSDPFGRTTADTSAPRRPSSTGLGVGPEMLAEVSSTLSLLIFFTCLHARAYDKIVHHLVPASRNNAPPFASLTANDL